MANYLRGLSAGIILIIVIAAAAAIYLHNLSSIRAAETATVSQRAEHVERYLEVITRQLQQLKGRIESHYAVSRRNLVIPEDTVGAVRGLNENELDRASPDLRRELYVVTDLKDAFYSLAYDDKTVERVFYASARGFSYVVPPDNGGRVRTKDGAPSSRYMDSQSRLLSIDMVDDNESRGTLVIRRPLSFAGTSLGTVGVEIKQSAVRALLSNGESVGQSYLRDSSEFLGREPDAELSAEKADYPGFEKGLRDGLRIIHRFPLGEPYRAAARSSMWAWLVTALAAALVSFTVHRALRSEIIERRRAERELREAYGRQEKLASRLRSLAHELTRAQHHERKRIAARIHDDLQQLLVAMQMNLKQNRYEDATALVSEAIDASRDLTHQLRPPALYEAGLVAALRTLAEQMQRRHSIEVHVDASESVNAGELHYDLDVLLFESVRELIFNAVKHAEVRTITVRVRHSRSRLRISVEDKGRGFEIEPGTDESASKIGFGIFSVQERLRALDGDLSIDSVVGQGTTVQLSVPIKPADHGPAGGDQSRHATIDVSTREGREGSNALRIVVADDHAAVRQGLANALDSDPRLTVVGQASDGETALQAVERECPDVLVVDINMPRVNGLEAIEQIHSRWPEVAIFGLSVEEGTAIAEAVQEAGGVTLLRKSMDLEVMVAEITGRSASAE